MSQVTRFVVAVSMAAVAGLVALYALAPAADEAAIGAVLCLAAVGLAAQLIMHELPKGGQGSIAFLPFLASVLLAPGWMTVVAVLATVWIVEGRSDRALIKRTFNAAQWCLSVSGATLAYLWLGGEPLLGSATAGLVSSFVSLTVPILGMVAVFFAVNTIAVSAVIAISSRRRVYDVWRTNHLGGLAYDALSAPAICTLVWMYVRFGPPGALLLAVPLFGIRQLYNGNRKLERVNHDLLQLMVKAIEARDPYTSGHSLRVAHYSKIIAKAIGLPAKQVDRVGTAALLHDVGKIHEAFAPILRKPGKLSAEEWAIMQTHPIQSAELVSTVSHLRDLVPAVRAHHENWDGSGYPDQLAGEAIPLESRIIMFADTLDAMTTDRPYRKALGEAEVRSELVRQRGKQFDPAICDKLLLSPLFSSLFVPHNRDLTPATGLMRIQKFKIPA